MEKILTFAKQHWVLSGLFVILLIAIFVYEKIAQAKDGSGISAHQAVQLINREDGVILDIRRKDAFVRGHIVNATNIPLAALKTDIKKIKQHKSKPIIIVCAQGNESAAAAKIISENEFEHVKILKGGMRAWRDADLPVEK